MNSVVPEKTLGVVKNTNQLLLLYQAQVDIQGDRSIFCRIADP